MGRWSQRRQRGGSGGVTLPAPLPPATGFQYGPPLVIVIVGQLGVAEFELWYSPTGELGAYEFVERGPTTGGTTVTDVEPAVGAAYKTKVLGDGVLLSGWSDFGFPSVFEE